ncbi:MAG TPA: PAS domain S-box protein, partial [Gemmatimonadaceae bacterium]|nr:PAS domain S-box protein [Gemmatimonadaceae bacterium]
MHTAGIESLRKQVAEMRASVLQDPRRAGALAVFRRVYGVPGTSVMNHVADHGRTFLRADAAICAMVDETGVSWAGSAGCTPPASPIRGELLAEWTVISGTPLLFDDRESSVAEFADAREFGWRAVAAMPIVMDGVAVGTILMGRTGGGNWTDDDYRALQTWMAMNAILNDRRAQLARRSIDSQSTAAARFGAIFERAPMGIVLVDHEGIIEASNSAYADIAGVSRDAVVGRHVREFAQPFADDPSGVYLEEMLAGKRRAYTAERKIVRPDGEERIARVTTAQLREPGAEHPSHLAIVEDVTEYREAESALRDREEQLRQAQKMEAIGQLAGGLAHDFSNALAAISGFASLLREDTAPEDPQRKDIDGILRVAQRASGITRKLLTISKKQVQERATLEIGDVLQEFGVLVRPLLPTTIEYRLVTPSSPVYATIDRTQIEQALLNLSLNARDAMSSGGTLTITLEPPTANTAPPVARIIVEDDGPGIPPGIMTRLWEPFFSTKAHGSGLGLPMSLAIAREHGGDLIAESSSNRGAKFTLQIPVAESSIPA